MGNDKNVREVFYYKRYFLDFLRKLRPEVQLKFIWTLKLKKQYFNEKKAK